MKFQIKLIAVSMFFVATSVNAASFDVKKYGAAGNGTTYDTAALQGAIDAASVAGGGTVTLPPGTYLSASIYLKSHVTFELQEGATLLGSRRLDDYKRYNMYALLLSKNQQDITLCGKGTIDGQGKPLNAEAWLRLSEGKIKSIDGGGGDVRPSLINFQNCNGVTVREVTLKEAGQWVQDYRDCENLLIEGIKVCSNAGYNNDGIDIDGCKHVVVRGCDIDAEDDGICLKSALNPCDDVLVENCRLRSSCNGFKLGTSSVGGFRNITCRNLEIYDTYHSGIALEIVDGGAMENVRVSNISITNTSSAIFVRLGHRNTNGPVGSISNVIISDVTAEIPDRPKSLMNKFPDKEHAYNPVTLVSSSITGQPGNPVRDITLQNIHLIFGGIGAVPQPRATSSLQDKLLSWTNLAEVPELPSTYPDAHRFGILPAWAFYCRHADGLRFKNVTLNVQGKDYRPALVCDDIKDLELDFFQVKSAGSEPVIVLNDVNRALITNSTPPVGASIFIKEVGETKGIKGGR